VNIRLAAWLVGALVAIAAGWLLWRLVPLPSEDARLLVSALPLVAWGALALFQGRPAAVDAAQPSTPHLDDRIKAVRAALQHRGLAGRRARYQVPFYLLVGPPGAGKTKLLEHSTLDFDPPVAIGGMTWWIGSAAVFVEAALDPSLTADADEMIAVMKALRPRLPINGVLLAVSPADLTLADHAERRDIAATVARFLRDIESRFGLQAPVYAMLTKLDLIPGFSEFFDRLDPVERAQPWAFTLPYEPASRKDGPRADVAEAFGNGFRQLVAAIRLRLTDWMSREMDPVRSGRIMNFGVQIAALEPVVRAVLDALIPADGQRRLAPFLRGIFLTSAQQDALSIDAVLPQLSARFAMPRSGMLPPDLTREEDTQDYFIDGTIERGILPEAGLIARGAAGWRRRTWLTVALTAAVVLAAVGLDLFLKSVTQASIYKAAMVQSAATSLGSRFHSTRPQDLPQVLEGLDRMREVSDRLAAWEPPPVTLPSLADADWLKPETDTAYELALTNSLAPQLSVRLERDLVDLRADAKMLRALLAIAEAPATERDPPLRAWLNAQVAAQPDAATRAALKTHGDEIINRHIAVPIGPDYIDAARRLLAYKDSLL
jgi:type VI protein secretion system component VasK